ncbi:MAG TPA: hypothetical protein VF184_05670 [Phycisphaeraceae bacterium]
MQPYFSFESDLWREAQGAQLRINRFERVQDHPAVARGPQGAPDAHWASWPSVVHHDGGFRMWYTAIRPIPQGLDCWLVDDLIRICTAQSDDGVHWHKPDLRLVADDCGAAPCNIVPFPKRLLHMVGVVHDGKRFVAQGLFQRMLKDRHQPQSTFAAYVSDDGLHWRGEGRPATQVQHYESANSMLHARGRYWVIGQGVSPYFTLPGGRPCGRVAFAYHSLDLKQWKLERRPAYAYPVPAHAPFRYGALQVHGGIVGTDRGRIIRGFVGQMWPGAFTDDVRTTFGLAYSYDAKHWREPLPGEPLILPIEGNWEQGMIVQGCGCYARGRYTYTWYSAANGGNWWTLSRAIGVARIRRDGFAHWQVAPKQRAAVLQTDAIRLSAADRSLYLNVSASGQSLVDVEVLGLRGGRPLLAAQVRCDEVLHETLALNGLASRQRSIRLRFKLHGRAKLFGFYLGAPGQGAVYLRPWRSC